MGSRGPGATAFGPHLFSTMDRFALFVDAGYLYAEGGKLCCGTPSRQGFDLNVRELNTMLRELAGGRCNLAALRTYWYDGARDGIRTSSHQGIAALANVKLRLGGINLRGQQKGVDALIYRDLMPLARERSIADAFLLSGDEDLVEGVRMAQDQGVRVTVIGITARTGTFNQSRELRFEADEVITLSREELMPYFARVHRAAAPDGQPDRNRPHDVRSIGREFSESWRERSNEHELRELGATRPRIPPHLDVELLQHAEKQLGRLLRGDEEGRRMLRRGFWEALDTQNQGP